MTMPETMPMFWYALGGHPSSGKEGAKARPEKPVMLDPDLLKAREDDIMHNLVLEYLSHQCFPATARILAEGLPTASSSNTSDPTPEEPTASHQGISDAFPGPLKMIDTDVTMMSSSISDLASIIDPSIIATGTTPGSVSALDGMSASTITPSMLGWGPQSAGGTLTEGNGNGKTKAWQDDVDVDMNEDDSQPKLERKRGSTNEVAQRTSREAWIRQIEWRKEIRDSIRAGDVVRGMDLLRRNFPAVLENYGVGPTSEWKRPVEVDEEQSEGYGSSVDEASDGSGESSEDVDEEDEDEPSLREEVYVVPGLDEANTTTSIAFPGLKPGCSSVSLYLNLEIQSFIENVRQLEPSSNPELDYSSMASSMHSEFAAGDASRNGKTGVSNGDLLSETPGKSSRTLTCVVQARKLYEEATTYLDEDAAEPFVDTIQSVTALLAYTDMASSPLTCWLDKKRRFTLAEMVNTAILARSNPGRQGARSRVESIARQTSAVISTCKSRGFDVSPMWKVDKEGIDMASLATMVASKQSFDLATFLAER